MQSSGRGSRSASTLSRISSAKPAFSEPYFSPAASTQPDVRSLSSNCRMRSVFSRIALRLRNIHLGGASSGMRSTSRSNGALAHPPLDAQCLARSAASVIAPATIKSFFISHDLPPTSPTQYPADGVARCTRNLRGGGLPLRLAWCHPSGFARRVHPRVPLRRSLFRSLVRRYPPGYRACTTQAPDRRQADGRRTDDQ